MISAACKRTIHCLRLGYHKSMKVHLPYAWRHNCACFRKLWRENWTSLPRVLSTDRVPCGLMMPGNGYNIAGNWLITLPLLCTAIKFDSPLQSGPEASQS
eukprot:scaffold19005_cov20-Prasinocladus_malaysianus.AAC.1